MVILGGLELVAAGYIGYKYSEKQKERRRRLSEDRLSSSSHHHRHRRRHSVDSARRKHRHDGSPSPHNPNAKPDHSILKPTKTYSTEALPPPQQSAPYPYTQPGAATSWTAPPPPSYPPPPHQPYARGYGYNVPAAQVPYTDSKIYHNDQYNTNSSYQYPTPLVGPVPVDPPQWRTTPGASMSTTALDERRGRSPVRYDPNAPLAELSGTSSRDRPYNTHLSPTPHVQFAVSNHEPQPGEEGERSPPPRYEE